MKVNRRKSEYLCVNEREAGSVFKRVSLNMCGQPSKAAGGARER